MAWARPRDIQHLLEEADPTGVPASAIVAVVLVVLFLAVFGMAIRWSVDGLGHTQVATTQE